MAKIISGTEIARQVEYNKHTIFIGINIEIGLCEIRNFITPTVILTFGYF